MSWFYSTVIMKLQDRVLITLITLNFSTDKSCKYNYPAKLIHFFMVSSVF